MYRGCAQPVLIDAATLPLREERRVDSLRLMSQADGIRAIHLLPLDLISGRFSSPSGKGIEMQILERSICRHVPISLVKDLGRPMMTTELTTTPIPQSLYEVIDNYHSDPDKTLDQSGWREIGLGRIWAGIDSG